MGKKKGSKSKVALVILAIIIIFVGVNSCSDDSKDNRSAGGDTSSTVQDDSGQSSKTPESEETPKSEDAHIYDNAQIKDVLNGTRDTKLGEYSVISVDSSECTIDALSDWYFNYVSVNDFNWCMILYADKDDNSGVYSISGMVEKDVVFDVDNYGGYSLGDSENSVLYFPSDDERTLLESSATNPSEQE